MSSPMNQFDFFCVDAAGTKTALKKAGFKPEDIRGTTSWVRYGMRKFPRTTYEANIGYVEATAENANAKASELAMKYQGKFPGITTHVRYHCSD